MKLKQIRTLKLKEYIVKLEQEENELLLEMGKKGIVNDDNECINYAIKMLIEKHMYDGDSMSEFLKDRIKMQEQLNETR